jgi:Fur family zinc uptake transcriptional regulator
MTPGRKRVLNILERAQHPLGAYQLIDLVAAETGKRPAPVSIYRALDFLLENGLAHRLASRNAFMACGHRHGDADPVAFLICDACGAVEERTSDSMRRSLDAVAGDAGFSPRDRVIEVTGTCASCKSA